MGLKSGFKKLKRKAQRKADKAIGKAEEKAQKAKNKVKREYKAVKRELKGKSSKTTSGTTSMVPPRLDSLEPSHGADEAVVVIKGYLSQDEDVAPEAIQVLRNSGFRGAVYQLRWDASSSKAIAKLMTKGAMGGAGALAAAAFLPAALFGAGGAAGAALEIRRHWSKVKSRAKAVGLDYSQDLFAEIAEPRVSIVAHSLGARVAYYSLLAEARSPTGWIKHVILTGGAIRRDSSKDWARAAGAAGGKVVNIRNDRDKVLKWLFQVAEAGQKPIGRARIKVSHSKIVECDVTSVFDTMDLNPPKFRKHPKRWSKRFMSSHQGYRKILDQSLPHGLWD